MSCFLHYCAAVYRAYKVERDCLSTILDHCLYNIETCRHKRIPFFVVLFSRSLFVSFFLHFVILLNILNKYISKNTLCKNI